MNLNDIPIVQPTEGYVKWVCFLARLFDEHGSCLLEFELPDGSRHRVTLHAFLAYAGDHYFSDTQRLKLVRALH